jgi:hypothetical protein
MFGWLKRLFTGTPKWETLPYRAYICAGCEQVIQRNQRARRCDCRPGGMRHDSCMTGLNRTCPFCQSQGVLVVWKS